MLNKEFSQTTIVKEEDTAAIFGSGLLPVYATPAMIAFMENTAMRMLPLKENESSVGIYVCVHHLKAVKVGGKLTCKAKCVKTEKNRYFFELIVGDEMGEIVGKAEHERAVIDVERFMSKL